MATIWEVPDALWEQIQPVILDMDPPKATGRKAGSPEENPGRGSYSGCAPAATGTRLPKELGDDSTIHRTFQRWVELGVLERIWAVLVEECEELGGCGMGMGSLRDCAMGKARFGGIQSAPTRRIGPRRAASGASWLTGAGGPLSAVVAGANVHDTKLLALTLEGIVVERPADAIENLCLDKGYDNPTGHEAVKAHEYQGHIRRIGEEKLDAQGVKRYLRPAGG